MLRPQKYFRNIVLNDYHHRTGKYSNEDVLIVTDKLDEGQPLIEYFSRIKVRTSDPLDEGRNLECDKSSDPEEVLEMIQEEGKTYGIIITDMFFKNDTMSGREMVRSLRKNGYDYCVVYITEAGISERFEKHCMDVGADALLVKGTRTMKNEFCKMVEQLIYR